MERARHFRAAFTEALGAPPSLGVPLAALSSFGIGGPADFFFEARTVDELERAVSLAVRERMPFYIIGGGNNMLFDDAGFRGLIIRCRLEGLRRQENKLRVLSGTGLRSLLKESLSAGLAGLEFLAGIPGTLGGAIFGNAGAFGSSIGDLVEEATVLAPGDAARTRSRSDLGFAYRRSALRADRGIVLEALLVCTEGDRQTSEARIRELLEKRRSHQPPWGTACAGSYFKNPVVPGGEKVAAGYLLEKAGAKGLSVGDAAVYERHCNFIINKGNAGSKDVLTLAEELKERVFRLFGIQLEEEVIYLREDASWL